MSDCLFIEGLRIETCIGAYDWERSIRQTVVLDLRLWPKAGAAAHSDQLADALDYKAVADRLRDFVAARDDALIESLAEAVANCLLREFPLASLRLCLSKPGAVPQAENVGIIITRAAE